MVDDVEADESEKAAAEKNVLLRALTAHPGWNILRDVAESQILVRTNHIVLTPLSPEYTSDMEQYAKGEVAGMKMLLAIPKQAAEELKALEDEEAALTTNPEDGDSNV